MEIRKSLQDCAQFLSGNDNIPHEQRDKLLDTIKKADRELAIQTALERVRARSLSMDNTSELQDIIQTVHQQFLNLEMDVTGGAFIIINADIDSEIVCWGAGGTADYVEKVHLPFMDMPIYKNIVEGIKKGPGSFQESFSPMEKEAFFRTLFKNPPYSDTTPERKKEVLSRPGGYTRSCVVSEYTSIFIVNHHGRVISEHENDILSRMGKVFEQAYIRFLDIQKAEAQAREAKIEAALERVRAKAMAMQNSRDIAAIVTIFFDELTRLGLENYRVSGIAILSQSELAELWASMIYADGAATEISLQGTLDMTAHPSLEHFRDAWKKGEIHSDYTHTGHGVVEYWEALSNDKGFPVPLDTRQAPEREYHWNVNFRDGYLFTITVTPLPEEIKNLLLRFTAVFDQAYTRHLDLKKAEAQAREARIEAALERVRAKTMAMHNSEDISATVATFFNELTGLGLEDSLVCGVNIYTQSEQAYVWAASGEHIHEQGILRGYLDMSGHPLLRYSMKIWQQGKTYGTYTLKGDAIREYYQYLNAAPDFSPQIDTEEIPEMLYHYSFSFSDGVLFSFTEVDLPEDIRKILERFASVFGQTYTRYLDLKKAEKRAREAEIEAALERVRARSMAMHKSQELSEVATVLFQQVEALGGMPERMNIGIIREEEKIIEFWSTQQGGQQIDRLFKASIEEPTTVSRVFKAWKRGDQTAVVDLTGNELKSWVRHMKEVIGLPVDQKLIGDRRVHSVAMFSQGLLLITTPEPVSERTMELLQRFAAVFDQTYTRFLDLEKAETQAREAEIEAALERVRAKTMAMHQSEELLQVIQVIAEQLEHLNIKYNNVSLGPNMSDGDMKFWLAGYKMPEPFIVEVPFIDHPIPNRVREAQDKGETFFADMFNEELNRSWTRHLIEHADLSIFTERVRDKLLNAPGFARSSFILNNINLYIGNYIPKAYTEEENAIVGKFAKVFEQAYTRFLDLQKAEAQAREAQIEAALERVRSKTMAMHSTEDIAATVSTFFNELLGLYPDTSMRCGVGILGQSDHMELWTASIPDGRRPLLDAGILDMSLHPLLKGVRESWAKKESGFSYTLKGRDLKHYFQVLNDAPDYPATFNLDAPPGVVYHNSFVFRDGVLFVFTEAPLQNDIRTILERFAAVFGQTYTRYLDLQKAEERAREAQIEAALERVRAKAMGMHSSEDLHQTISTIFHELKNLGIRTKRTGLGLLYADTRVGELVTSRLGDNGEVIQVSGPLTLTGHPVMDEIYNAWVKQVEYYPVLKGAELRAYYNVLGREVDIPGSESEAQEFGCFFFFPEGCVYAWSEHPISNDTINVFRKFTRVVEITYRRYRDLVKAEAREKEAVKQASLDRVRAEIASMRTAADLERITPLIWNELTTLGVPFFRCGVFIVHEREKMIHSYLSNPKGESLAAWQVGFGIIPLFDKMVKSWKMQEVFLTEWDRQGFLDFSRLLIEHGLVDNRERYQSGINAPEHLVLHMVPFTQGMLYVGSKVHLESDQMELVQTLASAFSVAYSRYDDFRQLEKTLAELKETQAQLIQSEKMASLGELTAGIAHEIKNPLNFVNNFSEVSRELLEELMEELKKGDLDEVNALTGDLIQNLDKIVHHGRRADSIVRGMLQHSRSGDGKKEQTDLNLLADEYMRLAYHGLRARDKSFNATVESEFDDSIGKIEIIPQDIGRVLLNLLTNSFHAVSEKAKMAGEGYTPTVRVKTFRENGQISISVVDNGGGIPEKVREKIFQPFFTTKPTGEGTGLGLSMSYDIVTKGHGGKLEMQSEAGTGSTFTICLPQV